MPDSTATMLVPCSAVQCTQWEYEYGSRVTRRLTPTYMHDVIIVGLFIDKASHIEWSCFPSIIGGAAYVVSGTRTHAMNSFRKARLRAFPSMELAATT